MKKLIALLLVLALALSVCACSSNPDTPETTGSTPQESTEPSESGPATLEHKCANEHMDTSNLTWVEWDGTTQFTQSGNYVLTQNVTLKDTTVEIPLATEITICLNGYTLESNKRVFDVYGTLNILDCQKNADGTYKGVVHSTLSGTEDAPINGPVAFVYNANAAAKLNLYGGNLVGGGQAKYGGVIYMGDLLDSGYKCEFNMYDGVIKGGTVTNSGSAVYINYGGVFNMSGGTITENKAGGYSAVHINNGLFNMSGGIVTGNSFVNGGAVCVRVSAKGVGDLTLSGDAKIIDNFSDTGTPGNVHLATGRKIKIGEGGLSQDAKFGVTMQMGGIMAMTDVDYSYAFTSDVEGVKVVYNKGELSIE